MNGKYRFINKQGDYSETYQRYGRKYPDPDYGGYGGNFNK